MPHRRKTPRKTSRTHSRKTRKSSRRKRGGDGSRSKSTIGKVLSRFSSNRKSAAAQDNDVSPNYCRKFHLVFPFDTVPKDKHPIQWNRQNLAICKKYKDTLIR